MKDRAAYLREWYSRDPKGNQKKARERHKEYRIRRKQWFDALKQYPCMDCNKKYPPYVMDFDHREDKQFEIHAKKYLVSLQDLQTEIAKCDLVCANCHRERTHQRSVATLQVP